ncbi:MAG TPA: nucleotidyltransferase family protein [Candidatus Wunengus sp. YC60]|uniref:nucleotidyltransferase family protein n=1 Tax=Candidatus Wunengus sp. YC60 TaxID=3367697 RepID=UPI0040258A44
MNDGKTNIYIPYETIAAFCKRNYIRKLSFFGSVFRGDFCSDSDVDILVEFDTDHVPGFFGLAHIERDLSEILGKKVDLRT